MANWHWPVMIIFPRTHEAGRTIWRFSLEADDSQVPRPNLWVEGYARDISPDLEGVWLSLVLGPFAARRLVLPVELHSLSRAQVESAVGREIVSAGSEDRAVGGRGAFDSVMIRDAMDEILLLQSTWSRGVASDLFVNGEIYPGPTTLRNGSNAGILRRHRYPLDCVGELLAVWVRAPVASLGRVIAFLCREELSEFSDEQLNSIASMLGFNLDLPLARTSVGQLGSVGLQGGLPAPAIFRALWRRYKMFPEVIGMIYSDLEPFLREGLQGDASIRIADFMKRHVVGDLPSPGAAKLPMELFEFADTSSDRPGEGN